MMKQEVGKYYIIYDLYEVGFVHFRERIKEGKVFEIETKVVRISL